ncbi:MAG: flagellar FliJ family protein [Planctomycetes bacterium]|nr:flagellar FliJ family protein [Planctomycetota bacterium]
MKRFEFRLERMLKFQRQRERQAELHQQEARLELAVAESQVAAMAERLLETAASISEQTVRPGVQHARPTGFEHLVQVEQTLEAARTRVRAAQGHLDRATQERVGAATEAEALNLLRERSWNEHRKEVNRAQQVKLDDTALRQWSTGAGGT